MPPKSYHFTKYACLAAYVIPRMRRRAASRAIQSKNIFGRAGSACRAKKKKKKIPTSAVENVENTLG